tara:strand:+ start:4293 stop:5048 length:756 start_codon:yes stop_codon:yes gene_type:complete
MRILMICAAALFACSACASMAPSPVTAEYRSDYALNSISVRLPEEDKIPDRYDASVNRILAADDRIASDDEAAFRLYAENRGGLTGDNSGELFLEYLVASALERQLPGFYTGDRASGLQVEIVSTTFPNAATMMLVGEIIGTQFDITLIDAASGAVLVETTEPLSPFVQPSAGAGGGLLGIALRGGQDRHLMDLQRIAAAITNDTIAVLAGQQIYPHNVERLAVNPVPPGELTAPVEAPAAPAEYSEPLSD